MPYFHPGVRSALRRGCWATGTELVTMRLVRFWTPGWAQSIGPQAPKARQLRFSSSASLASGLCVCITSRTLDHVCKIFQGHWQPRNSKGQNLAVGFGKRQGPKSGSVREVACTGGSNGPSLAQRHMQETAACDPPPFFLPSASGAACHWHCHWRFVVSLSVCDE